MLTRRRVGTFPEENVVDPPPPPAARRVGSDLKGRVGGSPVTNGSSARLLPGSSLPDSAFAPRAIASSSQDRTLEFVSVIKSTQMRQNFGITSSAPRRTTGQTGFATIAKKIGKDLASTLSKLEKLTLLAVKRSHHSTDSQETEQLTSVVRQDLSSLNKQIAQLQQLLRTAQSERSSRHSQMHANAVVVALQSKLVAISAEFKAVLEQRNNDDSDLAQYKLTIVRVHNSANDLKANALRESRTQHSSYSDLQRAASNDYTGCPVVINMDDGSQGKQLHQRQQQMTRHQVAERTETMTSVEQTIVELGGIFQQFAHMVKEQEEMIQRIDTHIDESHLNIDVAHTEIVKYFHTVTSNRSLMIKIFVILIVFFTIFVYLIR